IERLHILIKRGGTGTPRELARRLQMSESTVYEYIKTLKELGAPLVYDTYRKSYVYQKSCSLRLKYDTESLDTSEALHAEAGYSAFSPFSASLSDVSYYW